MPTINELQQSKEIFGQVPGEGQKEWDAPAGAGPHQEDGRHAAGRGQEKCIYTRL